MGKSRPPDPPPGPVPRERIQKALSRAGVASRREAEALLAAGRVRVNGQVVTTPGTRIDPSRDRIEVDGQPVRTRPPPRWLMLHKPGGTLTTRRDVRGRRTVYDLLPPGSEVLRYVGRLDRDTEGLLLFTNQGDVAHRLLHPSSAVEREYEVGVEGVPDRRTLELLTRGVKLDDGLARANTAALLGREGRGAMLRLVLLEGRKREARRLLEAVGHPVRWLRRVRFGPQTLGDLARGQWREVTEAEVQRLIRTAEGGPSDTRVRTG